MYLSILALPLFGSATAGLLGRKLGVTGAHIVATGCLMASALLALVAFYEVGLCNSPVSINLFSWIDSESLLVQWGFLFDSLTVSMLLPVLIVSSLVHLYSISYMAEDPHNQRFFSYLSMFTFFMLVLVAGDNYLILFVGWEGIGISSYLLINFWYTRIQANKSGIKALTVNRVGDMGLSIGFFAILWVFGNVDYATVFRVAPYINETAITIIGLLLLVGAMAKSAQFGLHTWLPDRMEGQRLNFLMFLSVAMCVFFFEKDTSLVMQCRLPSLILNLSKKELEIITGCMLGDGNLSYNNRTRDRKRGKIGPSTGNCRYAMTMDVFSFNYLNKLFNEIFSQYSNTGLIPYPNPDLPQHKDKAITQYNFSTRSLPIFTRLHSIWYNYDRESNKYVKIVPLLIRDMFSPLSLAHWIMQDGYFDSNGRTQTILLCTESFTKGECIMLQDLLKTFGIVSTLKIRNKSKDTYRIRISKKSMPLVRELVRPHIHPDFIYKLGK